MLWKKKEFQKEKEEKISKQILKNGKKCRKKNDKRICIKRTVEKSKRWQICLKEMCVFIEKKNRDLVSAFRRRQREKLIKLPSQLRGENFDSDSVIDQNKSRQAKMGEKKRKKSKAKCYRDLSKVMQKNKKLKKQVATYKVRLNRLNIKNKVNALCGSPVNRVKKLIRGKDVGPEIQKKLIFGEVLSDQLKTVIQNEKERASKTILRRILRGPIMKKYRLLSTLFSKIFLKLEARPVFFSKTRLSAFSNQTVECARVKKIQSLVKR